VCDRRWTAPIISGPHRDAKRADCQSPVTGRTHRVRGRLTRWCCRCLQLNKRCARTTDGAWARIVTSMILGSATITIAHNTSALQGVEITLVGSTRVSSLIPAYIYSMRPSSFHCPRVEWDSGSTFDQCAYADTITEVGYWLVGWLVGWLVDAKFV
jgi:hypothetical protein